VQGGAFVELLLPRPPSYLYNRSYLYIKVSSGNGVMGRLQDCATIRCG